LYNNNINWRDVWRNQYMNENESKCMWTWRQSIRLLSSQLYVHYFCKGCCALFNVVAWTITITRFMIWELKWFYFTNIREPIINILILNHKRIVFFHDYWLNIRIWEVTRDTRFRLWREIGTDGQTDKDECICSNLTWPVIHR